MKRNMILIFALILLMVLSVFAEEKKENMKTALGLSAEQEQKIKDLKEMCRTEDSICFARLGDLRKSLYSEAGKDSPDEETLNKISVEIGNQHSLLSLCLAKQIQEMKMILTQEQFAKFVDYRQNKNKYRNKSKPK